jgi:hypothetical protein
LPSIDAFPSGQRLQGVGVAQVEFLGVLFARQVSAAIRNCAMSPRNGGEFLTAAAIPWLRRLWWFN